MNIKDVIVDLGTAHRKREPGKGSPDGRLKEYQYSRMIVSLVENELLRRGVDCRVDYMPDDLPKDLQSSSYITERTRELRMRVNNVKEVYSEAQRKGKKVLYISIHVNGSGYGDKWMKAHGWNVRVSPIGSETSRMMADNLFDAAKENGLVTQQPKPKQKYWEQSLYVLNETPCPAVLTENLFQDNLNDVNFLLSEEGKQTIVRLHVQGILKTIEQL